MAPGRYDRWHDTLEHLRRTLEGIRECDDEEEDLWSFAMSLDVEGFALAEMLPAARSAGLLDGLDLEREVHEGLAPALERIRERGGEEAGLPVPLEWGMTGLLLEWEWHRMLSDGGEPWMFFERLRDLRSRLPQVSLCERTVHHFCERVPAPSFPKDIR